LKELARKLRQNMTIDRGHHIITVASDRSTDSPLLSTMQPGQLLCDRYQIERELAEGGFGQTFLAVDTHLPRKPRVVVKLLKPIHNDPNTLKIAQRLFSMEAETLEQLGKDNDRIPSLYAYFELKGEFYLVQEYIEGETLTEELKKQKKFSESDTLAILKEILTGLTNVHREGKIHRDLKPDNIIRRAQDQKLVIIDFGAVKQVRSAATNPNLVSRTIIGTPGYTPYEQSIGYPEPASDIYAVGAIGIQCLTGVAPHTLFNKDSQTIEWQHLCQVNRNFTIVLSKMVATDSRQRYANATEALKAIESLIPSPQISTPPTPVPAPVVTTIPTIAVVPSSQQPTNQGGGIAAAQATVLPINPRFKSPLMGIDRRNFLKWLGFGGVGVALAWVANRALHNSPSLPIADVLSQSGTPPKLTNIQFTSIKLDKKGEIVDKPAGNADIFTEDLGNGIVLTMVKIPRGKFLMGSPRNEQEHENDESPQNQVNVSEFYLGQTVVTQAQWIAIVGNNPAHFKGNDRLPVEHVSWLDAINFCKKLSQKMKRTYRLPNEAEWEYACRAGTTTPFAFGENITTAVANYDGNAPYSRAAKGEDRKKTTPVGSFPPNLFGLYDLHGNVWEWSDNYNLVPPDGGANRNISSRDEIKNRLLRGGSWYYAASDCRSANRLYVAASHSNDNVGFRVVCLPSKTS
jgi:eukaryotic-like serine/threonine-protein kinase